MSQRPLAIGLIGAGNRGQWLAQLCAECRSTRARVVAGFDPAPAAWADLRRRYGSEIFLTDQLEELLERHLDAVIVASPDFLHEEQAVAALKKGLGVYLEKPMAITLTGADRILDTARRSGARLYVGHNMRHMAFVARMKSLIDAGAIGEVKACWARHFVGHGGDYYFRDWHAERRYSTGLLLQKAAHDIDVIHWLCGGYGRRVHAFGALTVYGNLPRRRRGHSPEFLDQTTLDRELFPATRAADLNPDIDVEDLSSFAVQLDNGVLATYSQCHYTPDYWRSYTVIGTEGRLENFGNGEPGTQVVLWKRRVPGYAPRGDRVYRIPYRAGEHAGADPRIIAEFLRFVRDGGATTTSPLAARESVAVGYTATESLRHGGRVLDIPPPTKRLVEAFGGKA